MYRPKFKDTIKFESCTGQDVAGERTYAAAQENVKCRLEYTEKNIKDFRENENITSAIVLLPHTFAVKRTDRITLPNGESPYIGSIEKIKNPVTRKVLYIEVWLGRQAPGEGSL